MLLASTQISFELWPLLVYATLVILIVGGMVGLSYFLGERHKETQTDTIYESGIKTTGDARIRFPVHFYLVAMFFVIFDLEAAFIISWAIAFRETGWPGYIGVLIFIIILLIVLLYEWRIGALDFGPKGKKIVKLYQNRIKENLTDN
ncbi:MAG TPA: NADH-quinone oxidoreductase subunit A [Ignavibacteriaceae bacterium]|nr:NADH-quinone oxidoreductase subunit A [Ignavibacteriaceae bacterium]